MTKELCPKCNKKTIGIIPICYRCDKKEYYRVYYLRKQEEFKKKSNERYHNNIEEERKKRRKYREKNLKQENSRCLKWYYENREIRLPELQKYYYKNKSKWKKYSKKQHLRRENDIQYRLKDRLSTRARMAILSHSGIKNTNAIELLGAPIDIVRKHIESQFKDEMCWKNWGNKTSKNNGYNNWWEIDHIIPCDVFDLKDIKQQKICFNYKNLQPLWYIDNNHKSNKILEE